MKKQFFLYFFFFLFALVGLIAPRALNSKAESVGTIKWYMYHKNGDMYPINDTSNIKFFTYHDANDPFGGNLHGSANVYNNNTFLFYDKTIRAYYEYNGQKILLTNSNINISALMGTEYGSSYNNFEMIVAKIYKINETVYYQAAANYAGVESKLKFSLYSSGNTPTNKYLSYIPSDPEPIDPGSDLDPKYIPIIKKYYYDSFDNEFYDHIIGTQFDGMDNKTEYLYPLYYSENNKIVFDNIRLLQFKYEYLDLKTDTNITEIIPFENINISLNVNSNDAEIKNDILYIYSANKDIRINYDVNYKGLNLSYSHTFKLFTEDHWTPDEKNNDDNLFDGIKGFFKNIFGFISKNKGILNTIKNLLIILIYVLIIALGITLLKYLILPFKIVFGSILTIIKLPFTLFQGSRKKNNYYRR